MGNIVNDRHNVILMSNGRYRCDDCGDIGSGYWAVSHQFPPRGEWSNTYRGGGSGDLSPDPSSDPADELTAIAEELGLYD
jgi:hypothetical protein